MIDKNINDDLRAAYGDDVIIDHVIKHGEGWVTLYHARGQHRVALYLDDGHDGAEWDLVVDGEAMELESALAIMGLGEDERKN